MAEKRRNPLGPTGEAVRANVTRLREALNLTYAQLSRKLDEIERPIPALGLRRIEAGDRRVDADDLVALALALDVSPITLLMPQTQRAEDVTPILKHEVPAWMLWSWLGGHASLTRDNGDEDHRRRANVEHRIRAIPPWDYSFRSPDDFVEELTTTVSPSDLVRLMRAVADDMEKSRGDD